MSILNIFGAAGGRGRSGDSADAAKRWADQVARRSRSSADSVASKRSIEWTPDRAIG